VAMGLTTFQAYRLVILPIAIRLIVPPATSESLNLLKNSSVALTISVAELTFQTRQIETYTARAIEALTAGTVIYLVLCVGIARLARAWWISLPATLYVEFFRGVPLVMVIFWIWFIIPQLLRRPIPEYGVALTAFVVFEAAYFGEIVRAGIQSVPRGQVEAATALGLTRAQSMRFVVLPQAIRNMVPSLVTQMIVLFKDTSLASIIGYVDLTKAAPIGHH